jgi:hypothetical protein
MILYQNDIAVSSALRLQLPPLPWSIVCRTRRSSCRGSVWAPLLTEETKRRMLSITTVLLGGIGNSGLQRRDDITNFTVYHHVVAGSAGKAD